MPSTVDAVVMTSRNALLRGPAPRDIRTCGSSKFRGLNSLLSGTSTIFT